MSQLGDVSMLDDGSGCQKEVHSIRFFFFLFFPPPPLFSFPLVPLSGEVDPSVDPSTKSEQAAGKSGSKRYDAYNRQDAAKIYTPQCGAHLVTIARA